MNETTCKFDPRGPEARRLDRAELPPFRSGGAEMEVPCCEQHGGDWDESVRVVALALVS